MIDKTNIPEALQQFLEGVNDSTADAIWLYLDGDPRACSELIEVVVDSHPSIVTEAPSKKNIQGGTSAQKA